MQTQKWVNLGLLVGSGLVLLFLMRLYEFLWGVLRLPVFEDSVVSLDAAVAVVTAAGAGFAVRRSGRANQFLNEVVVELGKVTWPARKETVTSSGVVVVLVGVTALLLTLMDVIWAGLTGKVFQVLF